MDAQTIVWILALFIVVPIVAGLICWFRRKFRIKELTVGPVKFEPKEREAAVVRAKDEAITSGVAPEHIDAVASALATLELLGVGNGGKSPQEYAPAIAAFPETFAEQAEHYALKSHFDRFLFAAWYLYENEQVKAVNTSDMARMYDKARWKKPRNIADVFAKAAQKRYFTDVQQPDDASDEEGLKMWRLTPTGISHLQSLRRDQVGEQTGTGA